MITEIMSSQKILTVKIYALADPRTGEIRYVGKTKQRLSDRLYKHLTLKGGVRNVCWIKSLLSTGAVPEIMLLEDTSEEEWTQCERFYIAYFRFLGMRLNNIEDGGPGCSHPISTEGRSKISTANKGRKHSESAKAKIRAAALGRRHSEATCLKISLGHSGKSLSQEHKAKISSGGMGRVVSPDTRLKIGSANRGRRHSAEALAKISAARKGRPWTEAQRASRIKV